MNVYWEQSFGQPPKWYYTIAGILAVIAIGAAAFTHWYDGERAAAIAIPAPAPIAIEDLNPETYEYTFDEVVLLAQADPNVMVDDKGTMDESRENKRHKLIPLYSTSATDTRGPAIGAMELAESITDEQLAEIYTNPTELGVAVRTNGYLRTSPSGYTKDSLNGVVDMDPNFVVVHQFMGSREEDLGPSGNSTLVLTIFLSFAALFVFLGLLRSYFLRRAQS